jgi:hypothetical protein
LKGFKGDDDEYERNVVLTSSVFTACVLCINVLPSNKTAMDTDRDGLGSPFIKTRDKGTEETEEAITFYVTDEEFPQLSPMLFEGNRPT